MSKRGQKRGHPTLVIAVLAFIAAGIALPIVIGGSGRKVVLESAGLQASPRDVYVFTTPVRLPAAPQIRIERGTLTLADAHLANASGDNLARVLASGGAKLALKGATVIVDATPPAAVDAAAAEDASPLLEALLRLAFDTISLRDTEIIVDRKGEGRIALGEVSAEIAHRRKSALAARGTFRALGQQLGFEATLGILPPGGTGPLRYPLKASVKGSLVDGQIDGRLSVGESFKFDGQASLAVTNLRSAARWLGSPWPYGPGLADFRAKGQVEWSGRTLAFQKAALHMDGNDATGTLSLNLGASRPSVEGTLAFDTLDLSRHLGPSDAVSRKVADVLQRAAGHDGTDLSLPLVRHLDADIRISANRVRLGAVDLSRSAVTLSLKGGRLLADIAEFEHEGGRGSGQIAVDMNTDLPRFGVRGKLTGFDLGRLLNAGIGQQVLYGRGDLAVDLAASGETVTQVLRTLEGKSSIEIKEGGRLAIDINALLMAPQRRVVEGWSFVLRGQTPLEQLTGRLQASHGVVSIETLEATAADAIISLTGSANLSQRTLDAAVRSSRRMASAQAMSEPVAIKGPWSNPVFRSDEALRRAADGQRADDK